MTSRPLTEDIEDDGSGFNPIEFARGIYNSIRPFRSQLSSAPEVLIESPADVGAASEQGENMPNAFFRMLGLPATRSEDFLTRESNFATCERFNKNQAERNRVFSQDETLNYFNLISPITSGRNTVEDIQTRNYDLSLTPEASDFNTMMAEPLLFSESLLFNSARRANLFPLVVDAAVPIYPLKRRVAPLFYDGDYILGGSQTRLSRPFLEHVLYMRTKPLSGDSDGTVKQNLIDRINALLPTADNTATEPITVTELSSFSEVELIIQQRFLQALKRLAFDYLKVREDALRSRQKVRFVPQPVENPEERSGQGTLPDEEADAEASTPGLDKRLEDLQLALAREEAIRFLLPTEEVNRSDKIRRLSDSTTINNFKDDVLISDFINLITYKEADLNEQIDEIKQERTRAIQEAEKIKRDIIYFTGEFTGLSIFDIIGVLYGLFTVEIDYLVGLLNNDAQQRLLEDPFFALGPDGQSSNQIAPERNPALLISQGTVPSVQASLSELQTKVSDSFRLAQAFASQDDRRPVRRRGTTCR